MIGLLDVDSRQRELLEYISRGRTVLVYYQTPPVGWQVDATDTPVGWRGQAGPCWMWIGQQGSLFLASVWEVADVVALLDAGLLEPVISGDRVRLSDAGRTMVSWLEGWAA